jgi:hypothetical protein
VLSQLQILRERCQWAEISISMHITGYGTLLSVSILQFILELQIRNNKIREMRSVKVVCWNENFMQLQKDIIFIHISFPHPDLTS